MTPGALIVVAGPDGTGKTTLVDGLVKAIAGSGRPVRRYHHVFRILPPSAAARRPSTTPHANRPYPSWLSAIKVVYLAANHLVGWHMRVRPFVRRGGVVILERGWSDMVVDPHRFRLASGWPAGRLARWMPHPDRSFVLLAPPDAIIARCSELGSEELERQLSAWRTIADRDPRARVLDASRPAGLVLDAALRALPASVRAERGQLPSSKWVALPPFGQRRWTVQARPPRTAHASLMVHQPMRGWARLAWQGARAAGRTGAFGLLPAVEPPDLLDDLREFVPPGGTIAVANLMRHGRRAALIIDGRGRPHAIAKIIGDHEECAVLEREASAIATLGPLVEAPLRAPAVLAVRPGMLVLEAATWRLGKPSWTLSPDLAAAIGRFHRCSTSNDGTGPTHGDFAPWNLLPIEDGWFLIDWEDARLDGIAFWDPLHYLVSSMLAFGRPRPIEFREGLAGRGAVGEALIAYADAAGVSLASVPSALETYLNGRPDRTRQAVLTAFGRELA
jgi:thymidylate kinase